MKKIKEVNDSDIAGEWDKVAILRDRLIQNGEDISLLDVTEPFILEQVPACGHIKILDCGCGSGHLVALIREKNKEALISGIDISTESIRRAKTNLMDAQGIYFENSSIINYSDENVKFDLCVSNMVLMDTTNLQDSLNAIYRMLTHDGKFVFTIIHPCFWPIYWSYFEKEWFDYRKEIYISAPFKTSLGDEIGRTTHIHRPLETYVASCRTAGFAIDEISELYPRGNYNKRAGYVYNYPRFMGFVCTKKEHANGNENK